MGLNLTYEDKVTEIKKIFGEIKDIFILHVDDELDVRTIYTDRMDELGIKTISASSAKEGLELLNKHKGQIVLIVSDIKMPEMDGFEFRTEAQKLFSDVPFCIASAHIDKDLALRGLELKIVGFLDKPFNEQQLTELIFNEAIPKLSSLKEDLELKLSFIADSENLIEESESILMQFENGNFDTEILNRFFAIMHTLKGASAFFEPKDIHRFVHAYEEIIKKIQKLELQLSLPVLNALFKGFDVIKNLFNEFKTGEHKQHNFDLLLTTLVISENQKTDSNSEINSLEKSNSEANDQNKDKIFISPNKGTEEIKVPIKLLDDFMQHSGEVTVIRNMLNKCVSSIERRFAGDRDVGMLTDLLTELHKINSTVQNKMSEIRKVSLKSVMKVLPRAVRDVSISLNKKVKLVIIGDELRVDTSIAEVLNNSLLHIVKNSIDHGIESASERLSSGKSEVASVEVHASLRDDKVIIKISDDGKGINIEAIKNKLLKSGIKTKSQIDAMTHPELYAMIFSSGFSTAQKVTEISGRGVGMSMVKDCVDAVGGQILIQSESGKGASFQIELPVPKSVLIASCLSVIIGTKRFSLIQDDILKVLQLNSSQIEQTIKQLEKSEFLIFDNELLPIVNLCHLLNFEDLSVKSSEFRRFVILQNTQDKRKMAVEVSQVLDVEDMVIKNLHTSLNSSTIYRGVTFIDDGSVGLILSTSGLMNILNLSNKNQIPPIHDIKIHTEKLKLNHHALTILISQKGTFALPQESIFRIEVINTDQMKSSGQSYVIPYRGNILKIIRLSDYICCNDPEKDFHDTSDSKTCFVVVIKNKSYYLGLIVDDVIDMVDYNNISLELVQDKFSIKGHLFIEEKTIPIVNIESLVLRTDNEAKNLNYEMAG